MKHLFLFLFDMADSIKASGSKGCNGKLSVETSRTLLSGVVKEKNGLHFSKIVFSLEALDKPDLDLHPRTFQRALVRWDWLWNMEWQRLLSFAF